MPHVIGNILLVFAFVLAAIEAFRPWQAPFRPNLGWLSLSLYFLSLILAGVGLRY